MVILLTVENGHVSSPLYLKSYDELKKILSIDQDESNLAKFMRTQTSIATDTEETLREKYLHQINFIMSVGAGVFTGKIAFTSEHLDNYYEQSHKFAQYSLNKDYCQTLLFSCGKTSFFLRHDWSVRALRTFTMNVNEACGKLFPHWDEKDQSQENILWCTGIGMGMSRR